MENRIIKEVHHLVIASFIDKIGHISNIETSL